ncbi:MAG: phospholipase D-like domain-containing protein [Polyangiaceae bacterium]|jgi:phosphatidylserine/phosphatidylglycerophosphate/cardiolipin synthase-like enzyme
MMAQGSTHLDTLRLFASFSLVEVPRANALDVFRCDTHSLLPLRPRLAGPPCSTPLAHPGRFAPSSPLGPRISDRRASRCGPRVHLKLVAIDGALLYLGSANFTGAGLGAKGDGRRNFELGIVTDDEWMLDVAQQRFDFLWRGG